MQNTYSLFEYSAQVYSESTQQKELGRIFDSFANRIFTLWTLLAEHEGPTAGKTLYDLFSHSKTQIILKGFEMSYTVDSFVAVARFSAKLVEVWTPNEIPLIEYEGISNNIMKNILKSYELAKNEEDSNKENATYNQQKYDIIKSMTLFAHKTVGAKTEAYSDNYSKIIAKDLAHLSSILYCALIESKPDTTIKKK